MKARTNAAFCTALRAKTAIRSGDTVRYDIGGVYIWRPGDTPLEKIEGGGKYIFTNPGTLGIVQLQRIALEAANLIGLLIDMPVTTIMIEAGTPSYQIGRRK